jgi:hypothetical protein
VRQGSTVYLNGKNDTVGIAEERCSLCIRIVRQGSISAYGSYIRIVSLNGRNDEHSGRTVFFLHTDRPFRVLYLNSEKDELSKRTGFFMHRKKCRCRTNFGPGARYFRSFDVQNAQF